MCLELVYKFNNGFVIIITIINIIIVNPLFNLYTNSKHIEYNNNNN